MPVVSIDHRVDIAREGPAASSFRHIVTSGRRRAGDIALHSSMQRLFHVARSSKESVGLRPSNRFLRMCFLPCPSAFGFISKKRACLRHRSCPTSIRTIDWAYGACRSCRPAPIGFLIAEPRALPATSPGYPRARCGIAHVVRFSDARCAPCQGPPALATARALALARRRPSRQMKSARHALENAWASHRAICGTGSRKARKIPSHHHHCRRHSQTGCER